MFLIGASSVLAWSAWAPQAVMNYFDDPTKRSVIPRFILDVQHPWVAKNQHRLESLTDAEAFLCSTDEPGKEPGDLRQHGLQVPPDIFDSLEITSGDPDVDIPSWPDALARLGEMKRCAAALARVKSFKVKIYVHAESNSHGYLGFRQPPNSNEKLLRLFGEVLEAMPNLEHLKWDISPEHTHWFEESFHDRALALPSVKILESAPFGHYMVARCPNLEILRNDIDGWWWMDFRDRTDPELMLVRSTASAMKLKRLEIYARRDGWTPSFATGNEHFPIT
jgi:hypothetical protein